MIATVVAAALIFTVIKHHLDNWSLTA